jgi:hypothetical protein
MQTTIHIDVFSDYVTEVMSYPKNIGHTYKSFGSFVNCYLRKIMSHPSFEDNFNNCNIIFNLYSPNPAQVAVIRDFCERYDINAMISYN